MPKVLIALPPPMLVTVDTIASEEHRTRSDLIREALRRYIDNYKRAHPVVVPIAPPIAPQVGTPTAEHGAIVRNEAYGRWNEEGK